MNIPVNGDDRFGLFGSDYLAMKPVGPPLFSLWPEARDDVVYEQVLVFLGPTAINVRMQQIEIALDKPRHLAILL